MIKKLLITLFVSTILTSCVNKRDLSQNTVIAHITVQPDGLHPFNDNSTIRSYIFNYTQKTLIKLDIESLDYIPSLVKNMPTASADNLSFKYELKEGVLWDDGTELNALFSENDKQIRKIEIPEHTDIEAKDYDKILEEVNAELESESMSGIIKIILLLSLLFLIGFIIKKMKK